MVKANEVMRIGRRRRRQAAKTASMRFMPRICCSRANSTIKMAFLQARPTRTIKLICVKTLLSPWRSQNSGDSGEQRHGDDENDDEGKRPAFVLRGEHEVHEKDGEREDVDHGVAGKDFLVGEFGPLELHAVGQLVGEELGHGGFGLPGTVAGSGGTVDFSGGKTVIVHHAIRAVDELTVTTELSGIISPAAFLVFRRMISSGWSRYGDSACTLT